MLPPGDKSEISFKTHMGQGMEGPHVFEIVVRSNDPIEAETVLRVTADFE
jgi:hypothetical protein